MRFREEIDIHGQPFHAQFRQGAISFSLDDLVAMGCLAFPNHIKIDVDGIEDKIVRGARTTLADSRLKSVLVELDVGRADTCRDVHALFEESGMKLLHRNIDWARKSGAVVLLPYDDRLAHDVIAVAAGAEALRHAAIAVKPHRASSAGASPALPRQGTIPIARLPTSSRRRPSSLRASQARRLTARRWGAQSW